MRALTSAALGIATVVLGGCASNGAAPQRLDGTYVLEAVNGAPLPAATWARRDGAGLCTVQTVSGTLLLDAKGNWSALVTDRNACLGADGALRLEPENSEMFSGTYTRDGDRLFLKSASLGTGDEAWIEGDRIVVTTKGIGDLAGQTSTFTARRLR